ncbi:MAG: deoxyguanosinetriphosphate triphosphohydrolase [Candidatus Omnitrophica bacterium CG07_land_8_20_14_0_80_50_8]|nr:MAG: deoxyguanosinetriphosphate triphosphohydrolase [Candidatus Omnitrophica bacterium CG1_02_49_16]PIU39870.1 MAG: deoxyguanosinetriphosphate triphosphohydrolase [Candidatus Omnitrophica bacterium CG07_land_8_20_14_0_80_50_8]
MRRIELEKAEARTLASYGTKSAQSRGRIHPEKEHPYRTAFQRDRDRIIHSSAFRRLEYKTQVFVNHEGDYYRTRLTHSLEADQIARVIARTLRLNEDLVETITLAHDLGHTPFGHAGEDELRELMAAHGGFDHNLQSLRVVDYLEEQYPDFRGLNLTYESRIGLFKHPGLLKAAEARGMGTFEPFNSPSLESQVVDLSDEIAYDNHDIDDGLTSGMIAESELDKIALWASIKKKLKLSPGAKVEVKRRQIIRGLINLEVTDLIKQSSRNIAKYAVKSPQGAMKLDRFTIAFSLKLAEERETLRNFLKTGLYRHYRVVRMTDKARRFVRALFQVYLSQPEQLPPGSQKRLKAEGAHRVICDYLAGMTDRYAQNEYRKFFEPFERM